MRASSRCYGWLIVAMAALHGCGDGGRTPEDGAVASSAQPLLRSIEQAKLIPSKPNPDGSFGASTAIDGNTAAIGMRWAASPGSSESKGAVYIFQRNGDVWTETAELKAPGTTSDNFGESIALAGDLLVVGAPYYYPPPGAVFTYVRSGGMWVLETKIVPEDGLGSKEFGTSVSLSGNTILVRDPQSGELGAAYIFVRNAGTWSQEARIAGQDAPVGEVAVSNDTAIISNGSRTQVFVRNGGMWNQQAQFDPQWGVRSMAFDGDTLFFGGYGGGRVFLRAGKDWTKTADVWPAQQLPYEDFGRAVALQGDTALIGAAELFSNNHGQGYAYLFRSAGGVWAEEARVTTNELVLRGAFGASVALSGDTLLVGAPYESTLGLHSSDGTAYALVLAPGLENGTACTKAADCASGFCTDGICCDTLCADTCVACSGIKKGQGVDGICGPIAAGTDPDAECIDQPAASCGTTGSCNGAAACEKHPLGTDCDDGNACTEGDQCVEGACVGEPVVCAEPDACHLPAQCNASTGVCEFALLNPMDPACSPQSTASCGCTVVGERATNTYGVFAAAMALCLRRMRRIAPRRRCSTRACLEQMPIP